MDATTVPWKGRFGPFDLKVGPATFRPSTISHLLASALEIMRQGLLRHGYGDAARTQDYGFIDFLEEPPYELALYGCWQPVEREVQRNPLTLIDARSLRDDDLVDYIIGGALGALPFQA